MSFQRPTFDESWYRVSGLRPRLRTHVQSHRQHFRGERWHVLRDPGSNKYYRLHEPQYVFVALLDGVRTVEEAWRISCGRLGDDAPTQGEAIRLLGQLFTSNLLEADLAPDTARIFERYRQRRGRETRGYLMSILFARVPLYDPNRMLDAWLPAAGWLFGPIGLAAWSVLMVAGLVSVAGRAGELAGGLQGLIAPGNLPLLYAVIVAIKLVHELGHGFACKHYGRVSGASGDVHTFGVMFLALLPVPYVDASSSWGFRSKWHRAMVGAAGMYVELAIAAAAAIVWASTASGTLAHALAYNAMAVAGVTTLLFNANPLVRFDGYYILSDVLEVPNLARRSNDYAYHLVRRYLFGLLTSRDPSVSSGERPWLLGYAVGAFVYRIFITVTILLFIGDKLFFVGPLLAAAAVMGWVVVPLGKFVKYLAGGSELARVRPRAVGVTAGVVLGSAGVIGLIPVPEHGRGEGVVEAVSDVAVHAPTEGWLTGVLEGGTPVSGGGAVLFRVENPLLRAREERLEADLRRLEAERRRAVTESVAAADALRMQVGAVRAQLEQVRAELAGSEVAAPSGGVWHAERSDRMGGLYAQRGERVGRVVTPDRLRVVVAADQFLGPRVEAELGAGALVELMVRGAPERRYEGRIVSVGGSGQRRLRSAALSAMAGGEIVPDRDAPSSAMPDAAEAFFEVRIEPATDGGWASARSAVRLVSEDPGPGSSGLRPGEVVLVRFELPRATLGEQWYRRIRQVLQRRFSI